MPAQRLPQFERGAPIELQVDGRTVTAYHGETLATALLAAGVRSFQPHRLESEPNRLYCGMGECLQCLVTVDGVPSCRACQTLVQPGMIVETCR